MKATFLPKLSFLSLGEFSMNRLATCSVFKVSGQDPSRNILLEPLSGPVGFLIGEIL